MVVQLEISDLGFKMQDSSDFEIFPSRQDTQVPCCLFDTGLYE